MSFPLQLVPAKFSCDGQQGGHALCKIFSWKLIRVFQTVEPFARVQVEEQNDREEEGQ